MIMLVAVFFVIMRVGVSVAVMQVVYAAVHYSHDWFYCNFAEDTLRVEIIG